MIEEINNKITNIQAFSMLEKLKIDGIISQKEYNDAITYLNKAKV